MESSDSLQRIEAVRRFNRFYTRQIGLLRDGLLESPFTLTEARVVYELAHNERTTATHLGEELGLDPGYLSRILRGFEKRGLLERRPSPDDGRQLLLSLTEEGQEAFAELDAASRSQIQAMLGGLPEVDRDRLMHAMHTIEAALGAQPEHRVPYILRPPQSGDMGWVVQRHGTLYNQEYGWDERFEGLVAEIVAGFIRDCEPRRERCWIAEREGQNVGSVFLVKHPEREGVAKLRLLLVEPEARGLGIGKRLVRECTRFARQAGYHTITLWTNSVLHAARRIYEQEGYRLVHEEPHHSFGHDLVGQTWELGLDLDRLLPSASGGLVTRWHVREWTTVVGEQASAPASSEPDAPARAIARVWRGVTAPGQPADAYLAHLTGTVLPSLRRIPGHRGARVQRREVEDGVEFVVTTFWASMDAIRAFAGVHPERAVVEPAARALLKDFEEGVRHYEVVHEGPPASR